MSSPTVLAGGVPLLLTRPPGLDKARLETARRAGLGSKMRVTALLNLIKQIISIYICQYICIYVQY